MQRIDEAVLYLIAETLGRKEVDANDNFFDLGGTSLSAAVLVTKLEYLYSKEISLRLLLENPVIGTFCHALGERSGRAC